MACTISFTRNVTRSCPRVTSTGNVLRPRFKANSQAEALRLCRLVRLPAFLAGYGLPETMPFGHWALAYSCRQQRRLSKMTA